MTVNIGRILKPGEHKEIVSFIQPSKSESALFAFSPSDYDEYFQDKSLVLLNCTLAFPTIYIYDWYYCVSK